MIVKRAGSGVAALAACLCSIAPAAARDLTFQERVEAQESIERVSYAHLKEATRPFEEAVTRALLERKVRTYLKESAALEAIWGTPVTAEMLGRELERMARQSRMPERLRALYAALRHDPVLIQECLARPVLVRRLARNFFAADRTIHDVPLRRAEALRDALLAGRLDPHLERPGRIVADLVRAEAGGAGAAGGPTAGRLPDPSRVEMPDDEFVVWSARLPDRPGEPGPLIEERDRVSVRVVLDRADDRIRVAGYTFEKRGFEDWWAGVEKRFDPASVGTVVSGLERIPVPVGRPAETWDAALGDPPLDNALRVTAAPSCTTDDTWDNGAMDDVPSPRQGHSAIWTGSQMIVWGGYVGTLPFTNTGARYDPATDTWTPTDTDLAPSPRHSPSAIWTGSRMIVWGGFDGNYLNTGGKYDPVTNVWQPTSFNNVPTGRSYHSAVWTGSLMIVWGGEYELGHLDSGSRYDPVTDNWAPTSMTLRPSARSHPSGFWTGSRMVVWGGFVKPATYPSTGGRYDPVTDTWTRNSTINAPPGRAHNSAVYTGRFMVVWGGHNGFDLNGGGRYCVCADCSCPDGGSTFYQDADSDGFGDPTASIVACSQLPGYVTNNGDCDDTLSGYWALPGESRDLMLTGPQTLVWSPPGTLGGTEVAYDLLRSTFGGNFIELAYCTEFNNPMTQAVDTAIPDPGAVLYYLVRAENACGQGPLTTDSQGRVRPGRNCP